MKPVTVSIVIPTLNSRRTIEQCLESIFIQDFDRGRLEIVVADAGSTDGTLGIISKRAAQAAASALVRVVANPLKTGEAGKAAGVKAAVNQIVALVDSDNVLPEKGWLQKMVAPFRDPQIVASEPIAYTYAREDSAINRYCALLGMNDPICLFLGNYDRYCRLTGRWTGLDLPSREAPGYKKVLLTGERLPTIGANGFLIRRQALLDHHAGEAFDYLFDIDVLHRMSLTGETYVAKVYTSIRHLFCDRISHFYRKQSRRVNDYLYYRKSGTRSYNWGKMSPGGYFRFALGAVTVFPLALQALEGYRKAPDRCWLLHPLLGLLTLTAYGAGYGRSLFSTKVFNRESWRQ
jgi:glycosyltransferase involved in cell wall biosynthesis